MKTTILVFSIPSSERKAAMLDNSEYLANEWLAETAIAGMMVVKETTPVVPTKPSFWQRVKRWFK